MGLEGFRLGSILLVALIIILLFGTKRIRHLGEDLGNAVRSFRKGLQGDAVTEHTQQDNPPNDPPAH